MTSLSLQQPLTFQPIFKQRVWGGRRLETLFGKRLPPGARIGESWEIVDRPEAQSIVVAGKLEGRTLHDLWLDHREEIFGNVPESVRFPLLIKFLDAQETLSLQVHPPAAIAADLGGEPKTEFWYIAEAGPGAELYVGLHQDSSRTHLEEALQSNTVAEHLHAISVRPGDAMFLPSGRMHAIGAGNLIVEVQQNSDTTYRVFDWNRSDANGQPRELHIEQALRSIDFEDHCPELVRPTGESLVKDDAFEVEKWLLEEERIDPAGGRFAIFSCLSGEIDCAGTSILPGGFLLMPASLRNRRLTARAENTALLRITLPT